MSFDASDRSTGFDPRFSQSFQRGGADSSSHFATPLVGAPHQPSRSDGFDALEEMLDRESPREASASGSADSSDVELAPGALEAQHRAIAFVRRWGAALIAAGLVMTVMNVALSVANQSSYIGMPALEQQLAWALINLLSGMAPSTIVLGIAALLYAGYRSRLLRRDDRSI